MKLGLVLVLFLFCLSLSAKTGGVYEPGKIIVKVASRSKTLKLDGIKILGTEYFKILQDLRVVTIDPSIDVKKTILKLRSDPNVIYAEPNYIYSTFDKTPNDRYFSRQWSLRNRTNAGADIGATKAWSITTGSKNVVVAVIDTGIDYNHSDLSSNIWINSAELNGQDGVDDDDNGFVDDIRGWNFANNTNDPMDDRGHGSHVAGTIGATTNNKKGIAGVAWKVSLMPLKFLDSTGSGTLENAIRAVEYAILNGAQIINCSWGGKEVSEALKEAFGLATSYSILSVAAAGNSSADNDVNPMFPASYNIPGIISIASTEKNDTLSTFSNYGKNTVHLAAPGNQIYSTTPDNSYQYKGGTSMAAPHVSGASALILSKFPKLDALDLKERLLRTSDKLSILKKITISMGRLNVYNALKNIEPKPTWPEIDDPTLWKSYSKEISSRHPYKASNDETWKIKHNNAKYMRVHLKKYELEKGYDFVFISGRDGVILDAITGDNDGKEYYSEPIKGDTIYIRIKTDSIVHKYGFDLDSYEVILK